MTTQPKILAFAGSLRKGSFNKMLVKIAAKGAQEAGAQVTLIDLADYPLPIYNGDLEEKEGLPENALKLKKLFLEADGFIIASPEYNSSISACLKNVIDWVSRPAKADEVYLCGFIDKVALILSASPGALGGLRGLVHLRSILGNINTHVLPAQKCISNAAEAFDEQGNLKKTDQQAAVEQLGKTLTDIVKRLRKST